MRYFLLSFILLPLMVMAQWAPDVLGDGYQMKTIDQGTDYSGAVRCTVIRKLSPCSTHDGVLYVHGYSDYFFQKEMGDRFVDSCYNFYAVDLRKYGRSILPDQRKFEVRDLKEYFADIDSALAVMRADGIRRVVLIGHSTGGLITSYFMSQKPDTLVKALVLNSPFLDWNKNAFTRKVAIPLMRLVASMAPNMNISNGNSSAYSESLLKKYQGEWDYNTDWKPFYPEKVTAAWIRAIDRAQGKLQKGGGIDVPILLMHSDKSIYGDKWDESFQTGDAVLNVEHFAKYGIKLGGDVTEVIVPDGLHDLVLSAYVPREIAYNEMFAFIAACLQGN